MHAYAAGRKCRNVAGHHLVIGSDAWLEPFPLNDGVRLSLSQPDSDLRVAEPIAALLSGLAEACLGLSLRGMTRRYISGGRLDSALNRAYTCSAP